MQAADYCISGTLEHECSVKQPLPYCSACSHPNFQLSVLNCFTVEVGVLAVDSYSVRAGRILCYTFATRNLIEAEGLGRVQLPSYDSDSS